MESICLKCKNAIIRRWCNEDYDENEYTRIECEEHYVERLTFRVMIECNKFKDINEKIEDPTPM